MGTTLGLVLITHPRPNAFDPDDRALAQAASDVCALAIHNLLLAEDLRRVTSTDSLTGAYNRQFFEATLQHEIGRCSRQRRSSRGGTFHPLLGPLPCDASVPWRLSR